MSKEEIEVGTFEAKNTLSALVERASRGGRIWITKRGRRVALLSSGSESPRPAEGSLAERFGRIRERAKPGTETLKELVEEGRR
ncbi:MAG: type II toxin-antitoxin system Phd/YefM family antitoxin [Oceanipulchritudo sp.]